MKHHVDEQGIHWFEFDKDEAKGRVGIQEGAWGPQLYVNGDAPVGYIDLFPCVEGDPAQVLFDSPDESDLGGEPLCKVVLGPGGPLLIVHADAYRFYEKDWPAIHSDGRDPCYRAPGREEE